MGATGATGPSTVADNVFTLQDNGDATKQLRFELSGITAGQTRTVTAVDASGTMVLTTGAQTLETKSLIGYLLPIASYSPASGGTATIDLTTSNEHVVTMNSGSGTTTIALPTPAAGQQYTVTLVWSGTTQNVSWTVGGSGTLKWEGGTEPTATKVNGKEDIYVFSCRVAGTIRGSNGGRNY